MTRWSPDLVLVFRSVNINKSLARVCIVFIQPVEPKNPRGDEILRVRQRVSWPKRYARFKNCSRRGVVSDLLCNAKVTERCLQTSFLSANAETGSGNREGTEFFTVPGQNETLIANGNVDFASGTLHRSRAALQFAAVKKEYHIAVVGATGAVGAELLRVLERRNFPAASRIWGSPHLRSKLSGRLGQRCARNR